VVRTVRLEVKSFRIKCLEEASEEDALGFVNVVVSEENTSAELESKARS